MVVERSELVAVLPALDCAGTITEVVRGLAEHVGRVVVVSDGSRDATASLARQAGAEVEEPRQAAILVALGLFQRLVGMVKHRRGIGQAGVEPGGEEVVAEIVVGSQVLATRAMAQRLPERP